MFFLVNHKLNIFLILQQKNNFRDFTLNEEQYLQYQKVNPILSYFLVKNIENVFYNGTNKHTSYTFCKTLPNFWT